MIFTEQSILTAAQTHSLDEWINEADNPMLEHPGYAKLLAKLSANILNADGEAPVVVSISGSQGSGKSTLAAHLQRLLDQVFDVHAVSLSLDDFYLTLAERETLAEEVHPLLRVRGVPGTHDLSLMERTLDLLRSGQKAVLPVFDKASDDRAEETRTVSVANVVICEGWCWGAGPQPEKALVDPVNELESREDPEGIWRCYVNERLHEYQSAFASDAFVFLRVPDMEAVYRWRWQQEQDLKTSRSDGGALMDEAGVRSFIAYYERITRWMLADCPRRADVVVSLNEDHQVAGIEYSGRR